MIVIRFERLQIGGRAVFAAEMDFAPGEDCDELRTAVRRWAQERLRPLAAGIDESNEFPPGLWREPGGLGHLGITVPEESGGSDLSYVAHLAALEETAGEFRLSRARMYGVLADSELPNSEREAHAINRAEAPDHSITRSVQPLQRCCHSLPARLSVRCRDHPRGEDIGAKTAANPPHGKAGG